MDIITKTINKDENAEVVIEQMFKSGAHFGRSKSRRHPSIKDFIFGVKNTTEIIDLEKTVRQLFYAKEFVSSLAREKKQILFVGTKNESRSSVKDAAVSIGMPYVFNKWIGGTLTNFSEIKKRIARLEELVSKKDKGELGMYTKKERLMITREIEKLERMFGGIVSMKQKPAALFVVDSKAENIAVMEARHLRIPVISLSGSDCDIKGIEYPIVANDSSSLSASFFANQIADAYRKGASLEHSKKDSKDSSDKTEAVVKTQ